MQATLHVKPDGSMMFIYADALAALTTCGQCVVKRASHVEPTSTDDGVIWTADMSPSNGPVLGPFATRQEALDAEVEWLDGKLAVTD
jgi:hypothetical protein